MPETQLEHPNGYIVYAPMKIGPQPSDLILQSKIDSKEYLISEKKDGAWFQLQRLANGEVHLYSRTVSRKDGFYVDKIDNVPHIKKWAEDWLEGEVTLIGEIYIPGGKSNNVTSIMGCLPKTAIQRQFGTDEYGGPIHYYVHDIIKYNGKDLFDIPLYDRVTQYLHYMLLECFEWYNGITREGGRQCDQVELAEYYQNDDERSRGDLSYKDFNEYINEILAKGGEGVVLKHKDGLYKPGKRPSDNIKVKQHKDNLDLVIMDCLDAEMEYKGKELQTWPYWAYREEGTKNPWKPVKDCDLGEWHDHMEQIPVTKPWYHGWKTSVVVGAYLDDDFMIEIGRVSSGFTDEDRAAMGKNPNNYIGQVIECACMSVDKNNVSLRHPVFIKFRPDKNAKDCLLKDIFGG